LGVRASLEQARHIKPYVEPQFASDFRRPLQYSKLYRAR
jgi:hypothetical protein